MDTLLQMMKSFMEMQQKTFSYWQQNIETMNSVEKNNKEILENTIKFHKAAVDYHNSIVSMLEAVKDNSQLFYSKK